MEESKCVKRKELVAKIKENGGGVKEMSTFVS